MPDPLGQVNGYGGVGRGDLFHHVRHAAALKAMGNRVILSCPEAFHPLLSRCPGVDQLLPQDEAPASFDVHASVCGCL